MVFQAIKIIVERVFSESENGKTKQMLMGASAGFVTGMLSVRIGKTAALALGGGIILLQIANDKNYITVHWDKVNRKVDEVVGSVEEEIVKKRSSCTDKIKIFTRNNTALTSFFIGGFLVGLAS
ncbi:FUN14 domain-containing protein 1-like [Diorhabda carinulata]|uniref:FUN14 domain-containing protein 1-like n=1 Tax=Diorhabda sublineata TaxID=1163346 RepID=UPI0024E1976D|nr:FUN14 domain-containing protein 1-like [Diorhabda sublineata]XP_057672240.1 FUN14 domain-containing protein 1-like [Diorhabda carinulata]